MSVSDVLVLASTSEPFGAVVAEGLQWGTPCLVSDNCGSASLIENGLNGMVFKSGDAEAFRTALARLPQRSSAPLLKYDLRKTIKQLFIGLI